MLVAAFSDFAWVAVYVRVDTVCCRATVVRGRGVESRTTFCAVRKSLVRLCCQGTQIGNVSEGESGIEALESSYTDTSDPTPNRALKW